MKNILVILSGIYITFLGLVLAGMIAVSLFFLDEGTASLPMNYNPSFLVISYLPLTIWLLTTGIGIISKKSWSRYSLFIMSFFALFIGLVISITFLFFPAPTKSHALRILSFALIFFLFIVIPIFFLIFFSRKKVKELFKSRDKSRIKTQKSFGILLVSIITLLGGIFSFFYALFPVYEKLPVFGSIFLTGFQLKVYFFILAACNTFIAIGILRLARSAWLLCIIYNLASIFVSIINIFTVSKETISEITPQMSEIPNETLLLYYRIYGVLGLLIPIAIIAYLISRKKVFRTKPNS
ncbi:MAG: hypothetical protein PHQ96_07785 [Candidatus Omnitrophica bacterium]|nr:hypothetical protein [Candidatus Omnitrophota bacterium]